MDCKDPSDQEIVKNAPRIEDYLTPKSKENFDKILKTLDNLGIEYEIDRNLVRGLDYYSDVVFEFHYTSSKGINYGALCGGGHYNKLIQEIGGPKDIEGCGFAIGIERIASVMNDDNLFADIDESLDCYVMPLDISYQNKAIEIATTLRLNGFKSDVNLEGKGLKGMLKKALKFNTKYALILGEDEVNSNKIVVKDLKEEKQESIELDELISYLDQKESEDCECHHHQNEE